MKKMNNLEEEERINREEAITLIDDEIHNRGVDDLLLNVACAITATTGVSLLIDGIKDNRLYMCSISALIALGGLFLCKASIDQREKTGYLKAVSSFLKANDGKENTARYYFDKSYSELTEEEILILDEKGYFEPAVFSFSNDANSPLEGPTRDEMKSFLVDNLSVNTKNACKELKLKVKTRSKSNIL